MVRTDEWEDSDEDEESDREEEGENGEHIYNINPNSAEDSEEDSEDEEINDHVKMVVAEHHHNYESENETDTDQQEDMNTTEDQKWFMNMKLTHEHTNWTHEYGRLVLSTNDESWRMSKPGEPITIGLIDQSKHFI